MEQANPINVDVCIIGGGICGIIAAHKCIDNELSFIIIEKNEKLGGVWHTVANDHSQLQAFEPNYRFHSDYKLGKKELEKHSAKTV